jgi:hypothetical protein
MVHGVERGARGYDRSGGGGVPHADVGRRPECEGAVCVTTLGLGVQGVGSAGIQIERGTGPGGS